MTNDQTSSDREPQSLVNGNLPSSDTEIPPELLGIDLTANLDTFKLTHSANIKICTPDKYDEAFNLEYIACRLADGTWADFTNISNPQYSIFRMGKSYPLSGTDGSVQYFTAAEAFQKKIHKNPTQTDLVNELGFKVKSISEHFYKGQVQIVSNMFGEAHGDASNDIPEKEITLRTILYLDSTTKNMLDQKIESIKLENLKQKDKNFSL